MQSPQQQHQPPPPMNGLPYQQHPPPRRASPMKWVLVIVGVLTVLVILLIVLSTVAAKIAGGLPKKTPDVPVQPSQSAPVAKIPKPNGQQTEDLLSGLRQIDKELDRSRSIDRARNTCSDMLEGKSQAQIVKNTQLRFDGVAHIDRADAKAIVKLIKDGGWCR